MNREEGIIIRKEGNTAWVRAKRSSMCEVCSSRTVCNTLDGGNSMEAEVYNPVDAEVGDRVEFVISTASLLKMTSLMYLFPVIFLLAGTITGYSFFQPAEFFALIFGLSAFFVSYLIIRMISKKISGNRRFTPEIIRIIKP